MVSWEVSAFAINLSLEHVVRRLNTVVVAVTYHFGIEITRIPPYFGSSGPGVIVMVRKPSEEATMFAPPPLALMAAVGCCPGGATTNYVPKVTTVAAF